MRNLNPYRKGQVCQSAALYSRHTYRVTVFGHSHSQGPSRYRPMLNPWMNQLCCTLGKSGSSLVSWSDTGLHEGGFQLHYGISAHAKPYALSWQNSGQCRMVALESNSAAWPLSSSKEINSWWSTKWWNKLSWFNMFNVPSNSDWHFKYSSCCIISMWF